MQPVSPTREPAQGPETLHPAEPVAAPDWRLWWLASTAFWTIAGFASATFFFMSRPFGAEVSWGYALRTTMISSYLWIPLTVGIFWVAHRYPLERAVLARSLPVHAVAGVLIAALRTLLVLGLNPVVGWYADLPPFSKLLFFSFDKTFFLYCMIVGVAHAAVYAERWRQREVLASRLREQLARSELQALKAQLHPHFLFNTLNAVSTLMHRDPEAADRMLARLGDLLRLSLEGAAAQEVPLREEIRFLEPYLEIEQTRFEDRLAVAWSVEPETLDALVPHLLLQPLVENALRHGIAPRAAPGRVEIAAWIAGGRLRLRVRDDGVGLAGGRTRGLGVGLSNTRNRLSQLYGAGHRFELRAGEPDGVVVEVELPHRRMEAGVPCPV
jgi:two-component system, LytTR family, sensor kinase